MIESELEIFDRPIDVINWIKKMSNLESKMTVNPNNISDLDKILYIKGIRDFYDDVDIHEEEFDQLYHKITRSLEFTENFKTAIPYLKEILTEQQFGVMQVFMDKEAIEILAYLAEKGESP